MHRGRIWFIGGQIPSLRAACLNKFRKIPTKLYKKILGSFLKTKTEIYFYVLFKMLMRLIFNKGKIYFSCKKCTIEKNCQKFEFFKGKYLSSRYFRSYLITGLGAKEITIFSASDQKNYMALNPSKIKIFEKFQLIWVPSTYWGTFYLYQFLNFQLWFFGFYYYGLRYFRPRGI